jgi:carboxylate-amine ligase
MKHSEPTFTIGVEEEYLLVDQETRALIVDAPESLMRECEERCGAQVATELLRSQIEIGTKVCTSMQEVRDDLLHLRRSIKEVANSHGLAPIASSTHPFSRWQDQKPTRKERYDRLTVEMQSTARRLLICGMHVHVGIDNDELRIDLMNQMSYFLPHLLALSCSSPFWEGEDTTGVPERFSSYSEYERHVQIMMDAGLIEDSTRIWWDIRPSGRFPTLETRIMDVCTRVDDTVALAALLVCILRMLYRLRRANQRWRQYTPMLIQENRWRAMRYSFDEGLIDLAKGEVVPFVTLLDELLSLVAEDAEALGCTDEINSLQHIVQRGTSAHRQLKKYDLEIAAGASKEDALKGVVDKLIQDTAEGL